MALMLFIVFVVLMFLGIPIAFSLGASSMLYLFLADIPLNVIPQKMYSGIDSFVLLCIPGFVLAGNLMNRGGMTKRIVNLGNALVGHITGGLGLAAVIASMVFAGISGTALAEVASIGAIMIPAMVAAGYNPGFASAITASASTLGPIIPPSVPMIVVGSLTGLSISKLFAAGALPGLLLAVGLMIVTYFIAKKHNYPKFPRMPFKEVVKVFYESFWAILMTMIILYGILGGLFTPTEAAVISVIYALIIGFFVYKELKIRELPHIIMESMTSTAGIMILVGFASTFSWILASEQVPQLFADSILSITTNKYVILILINLLLIFVGMFMETISALIILFPVLLKVAIEVGVDPIHFAIIVVLNLVIGLTTPPVGVCLFVAQSIGKLTMAQISRAILPTLGMSLIVLGIVTFCPDLVLFLPRLLFGK